MRVVYMNICMIMKKGVEAPTGLLPIVTLGGWDREGDRFTFYNHMILLSLMKN